MNRHHERGLSNQDSQNEGTLPRPRSPASGAGSRKGGALIVGLVCARHAFPTQEHGSPPSTSEVGLRQHAAACAPHQWEAALARRAFALLPETRISPKIKAL
jgi:hypothetical protein